MKVNLYGTAYHTYDYYFFTNESLETLFCNVEDLEKAINYIEGNFAIQIIYDDKEMWITDCWGMFPIFFNPKICEVRINLSLIDMECININYLEYVKNNIDERNDSNIAMLLDDYWDMKSLSIKKFNMMIVKDFFWNCYTQTLFQNWYIIPANCILTIKNKKYKIQKYDFREESNENPIQIFQTLIKKMYIYKNILSLSYGYDSRCIYSVLYDEIFDRFTYGREIEYVSTFCKKENIYDSKAKNINDFQYLVNEYLLSFNSCFNLYTCMPYIYMYHTHLKKYDILFSGFGANEFYCLKDRYLLTTYMFSSSNGHLYKLLNNYANIVMPYLNKRFYNSYKNKTKKARLDFYECILKKTPDLLNISCSEKYLLEKNNFHYNNITKSTKVDYIIDILNKFQKDMFVK